MNGYFISFEGSEGSGKSTQITLLEERLRSEGFRVVRTREPGGTPIAEEIRAVLLTPTDEEICTDTELLLMFASRAQLLDRVIRPALKAGSIVLCDRYVDSSYAYQHYGRMIPKAKLDGLFELSCKSLLPDTTIHLDQPVEVGLSRAAARGQLDRFESAGKAFFARVAQGFRERSAEDPTRFVNVDATQSIDWVAERVYKAVSARLNAAGIPRPNQ